MNQEFIFKTLKKNRKTIKNNVMPTLLRSSATLIIYYVGRKNIKNVTMSKILCKPIHPTCFSLFNIFFCDIFKAKLPFVSAFNVLKFLSIFFLLLSDFPNLDLNNLTDLLIKRTLVEFVYSSKENTDNIKEG
jgi:hypothetical protein